MHLGELQRGITATVAGVRRLHDQDAIAERLQDLGFVDGESVTVVAEGPFGGDPIVVRVGQTRFALRRTEAARVELAGSDGR